MKERMSGDCLLMSKEGWKRMCLSPRCHKPGAEALLVPLCQYKVLLRTAGQSPAALVAPTGPVLDINTARLGLRGKDREGGRRRGGGLKIVLISFLQLSFTVHKRARGLPAPVHATPYIMGDRRALLGAGNRQGRDICAALPKPIEQLPGAWALETASGWGKSSWRGGQ